MEQSRLLRSQSNKVIGGVCGGLANALKVDPILFRVIFVLTFFIGGGGLLVYIILWIAIPLEDTSFSNSNKTSDMDQENSNSSFNNDNMEHPKKQHRNDGNLWGGLILITLGVIFLVDRFVPRIDFGDLWPLILIVVGIILVSKNYQQPKQ